MYVKKQRKRAIKRNQEKESFRAIERERESTFGEDIVCKKRDMQSWQREDKERQSERQKDKVTKKDSAKDAGGKKNKKRDKKNRKSEMKDKVRAK